MRKKPSCIESKLDVWSLKNSPVQDKLQAKLAGRLPDTLPLTTSVEDARASFRDAVSCSAEAVLGFRNSKHQNWLDQCDHENLQLIEWKHSARTAWLSYKNSASKHAPFKRLRAQVQRRTPDIKNSWWAEKADGIQGYADRRRRTKDLYSGLVPLHLHSKKRNSLRAQLRRHPSHREAKHP